MGLDKYILITPARNEESYIERTIRSVCSQTILPARWIIVSDGSTDRTDEIVEASRKEHPFIDFLRLGRDETRNFGSKARAVNTGYGLIKRAEHDFIGNLDADVTFGGDYYENILREFGNDPRLGVAGGIICEESGGRIVEQNISGNSCAGAVQLFRRRCYEDIGGYFPMKSGGIDAVAEITARMKGWKVRTFREYKVAHHRRVGGSMGNVLKAKYRQGARDYLIGYHPLFYLAMCAFRAADSPFLVGSLLRLAGYGATGISGEKRQVGDDFVSYLRSEQMSRLRKTLALGG